MKLRLDHTSLRVCVPPPMGPPADHPPRVFHGERIGGALSIRYLLWHSLPRGVLLIWALPLPRQGSTRP